MGPVSHRIYGINRMYGIATTVRHSDLPGCRQTARSGATLSARFPGFAGSAGARQVVGDGKQLRTSEAATALAVSPSTVIKYVGDNLLRTVWTAGGHRRIDAASVAELSQVLRIPPGLERDAAMEDLRRRNREAG